MNNKKLKKVFDRDFDRIIDNFLEVHKQANNYNKDLEKRVYCSLCIWELEKASLRCPSNKTSLIVIKGILKKKNMVSS